MVKPLSVRSAVLVEEASRRILTLRGVRVVLDADIAQMYGVSTKVLNQAIRRNHLRFPPDFLFLLTPEELHNLRSQSVTSSWGGRRTRPLAFTEEGIAMLSSVLRSHRAIRVNIAIMRAFVRLRGILATQHRLAKQIEEIERKIGTHDVQIRAAFEVLRKMMAVPDRSSRKIGFRTARR